MTATSKVMLPSGGRRMHHCRGHAGAGVNGLGLALAPTYISAFVSCLPTPTCDLGGEGLCGDSEEAPGPSGPRQDFCPQFYSSPHGGWGSWPPVSLPWSHLSQLRAPPLAGLRPLSLLCTIYCSPQENDIAGVHLQLEPGRSRGSCRDTVALTRFGPG